MPTITRTQNRRTLLASTQLGLNTSKSVSALTRSSTTATGTSTSHGFSVGDWVVVQGSDRPPYNGPFQVVTVADANTFTYTMESDPGATSAGSVTAQKGVGPTNLWGDGTTPSGSPASIGALPTATGGTVIARVATTTAPTTACRVSVFVSPTGLPGTWREVGSPEATLTANDMSTHPIDVPRGGFVLVVFWRVAGTAVYCDAVGHEDTSYVST